MSIARCGIFCCGPPAWTTTPASSRAIPPRRIGARAVPRLPCLGRADYPELFPYSEYQIGGAIPSARGEIYVAWNQLVRDSLQDYGLDRVAIPHLLTTADVGHLSAGTPLPPIFPGKNLNIKGLNGCSPTFAKGWRMWATCGSTFRIANSRGYSLIWGRTLWVIIYLTK